MRQASVIGRGASIGVSLDATIEAGGSGLGQVQNVDDVDDDPWEQSWEDLEDQENGNSLGTTGENGQNSNEPDSEDSSGSVDSYMADLTKVVDRLPADDLERSWNRAENFRRDNEGPYMRWVRWRF